MIPEEIWALPCGAPWFRSQKRAEVYCQDCFFNAGYGRKDGKRHCDGKIPPALRVPVRYVVELERSGE